MFTYRLTLNTSNVKTITVENLDAAHIEAISLMELHGADLCLILCNGSRGEVTRRVRKTGKYHSRHNGYEFD